MGICSYARKNADGLCYNFWSPSFTLWLAISIKNILCFFYYDTDYCIVTWGICSDIFYSGIYANHRDNFLFFTNHWKIRRLSIMKQIKAEWILCPVCGNKTRTMIRENTELKNFLMYVNDMAKICHPSNRA